MQYDGSAPTIATRQLPRSGFVLPQLCGAHDYAESAIARFEIMLVINSVGQ